MYKVTGGGASHEGLSAREALFKARSLVLNKINDVEIFRPDGTRISRYALDRLVRNEHEAT